MVIEVVRDGAVAAVVTAGKFEAIVSECKEGRLVGAPLCFFNGETRHGSECRQRPSTSCDGKDRAR